MTVVAAASRDYLVLVHSGSWVAAALEGLLQSGLINSDGNLQLLVVINDSILAKIR